VGYIDKTSLTATAHFTKKGRELLADALAGSVDDSYVITKFALGDEEIDYGLWDESQPSNLQGRIIENMPILESFISQKEIMNSYVMVETPEITNGSSISNILGQISLEGVGDTIDLIPSTENLDETEEYEFFLEEDNVVEMTNPHIPPVSDFNMSISMLPPPLADFIMSMVPGYPPVAGFTMEEA
jgi:hypothetical protein